MRVVVVDDSAFMRRAISRMLRDEPRIEIVGLGRNGVEAIDLAHRLRPDVITLDIEMPEMDGLSALRQIMRECPTQVLMFSSLTRDGSQAAMRALRLGAADVLAKDTSQVSLSIGQMQRELVNRIITLGSAPRPASHTAAPVRDTKLPELRGKTFDVICIGSSTGGPPVLETILSALPATLKTPVLVAQHMPGPFTVSMAERLNELCQLPVALAVDGAPLAPGRIYIAPGGQHLALQSVGLARWRLKVGREPAEALYHPSVDILFESAAQTVGPRALGVILTGMGRDGLEGCQRLHQRKATLLAQSAETCVVYGMPKGPTEQGLIDASLPPSSIGRVLAALGQPTAIAAA